MWAFMTTGTMTVLERITDKHPNIPFHYMRSGTSTLVYYESDKQKGLFVSGRTFKILHSFAEIEKKGFVVMENIPVVEDAQDLFEDNVRKYLPKLEGAYGIQAIKMLQPKKGLTYCIITQWKSEEAYRIFKNSSMHDFYEEAKLARKPAYFAERPFTSMYYMLKDDEEENNQF